MELATEIRNIAAKKYVQPAVNAGKASFSIAVRDLMADARLEGISTAQRTAPFCTSIQTRAFLKQHDLEVTRVDGPAKKKSTTVVVHYRVRRKNLQRSANSDIPETSEQRAFRLVEKIRGLMKEEIAAYGGGENYLNWVRGEDKEAA